MYSDLSQLIHDILILASKSKDLELKKDLNDLINRSLELESENRILKEKLHNQATLTIDPHGGLYWRTGDSVPYCSVCWDADGMLIHMVNSDYGWICPRERRL